MQEPDTQPGAYYVTAVDAGRVARLLGPFKGEHAHAVALLYVDTVRNKAEELEPRAAFWAFGTARWPEEETKPGSMNALFNL